MFLLVYYFTYILFIIYSLFFLFVLVGLFIFSLKIFVNIKLKKSINYIIINSFFITKFNYIIYKKTLIRILYC